MHNIACLTLLHSEWPKLYEVSAILSAIGLIFCLYFFRMFSYGEFKQEDQEKMLEQLNKKVEEVYRSCIGDNEANIRLVDLSISYIPLLLQT